MALQFPDAEIGMENPITVNVVDPEKLPLALNGVVLVSRTHDIGPPPAPEADPLTTGCVHDPWKLNTPWVLRARVPTHVPQIHTFPYGGTATLPPLNVPLADPVTEPSD